MASLYEIDQAILGCCDPETGEILDIQALDALMIQRAEKIEGVVCWIKNLTAEADAIKAEKDSLAVREAKCRKKAEDLKLWVASALNGQKYTSAKCAVTFRKSEKVSIQDESVIPNEFLNISYSYKPDRQLIRQAIKAGQEVKGCSLVRLIDFPCESKRIVILQDGTTTRAIEYEGRRKVKEATARLHPNDEYRWETGRDLALNRLIYGTDYHPSEVALRKEEKPLYNGKVVCVDHNGNNQDAYTIGRIYQFMDGSIVNDRGIEAPLCKADKVHSFDEWARFSLSKWIEIVE